MSLIVQHADLYLILACVFGFCMAWGIGANDVANAMGTSIGSGAIKFKHALVIAGIFEFLGAWLAGGQVTQTISKGLIEPAVFAGEPHVLVTGMLASLLGASSFLMLASVRGLPVSTGQSIIGGILGFALIVAGADAVAWGTIVSIVLSWIVSPVLAGIVSVLLFGSIRRLILVRRNPARAARRYLPGYTFTTGFVIALMTLQNGLSHLGLHISLMVSVLASVVIGLFVGLITWLILLRLDLAGGKGVTDSYRKVERVFGYAQIFTAATMAFAHGSNDVANAIGPVAAVANIVENPGHISGQTQLAGWVLLLGGIGIVVGLATYGRNVMRTIGKDITALTPTRGFSAELSAALVIVLASWFGLPVSTTQTLVGAVLGVGLARGMRALDLSVLGSIFAGWVFTLPAAAVFSVVYYFILRALIG